MSTNSIREQEFESWLRSRPAPIQLLARELPPWKLYSYQTINSGRRFKFIVYIESYNDGNGVLTVEATREYNRCLLNRQFFVAPNQLTVVCEDLHTEGKNHRIEWTREQQHCLEEIEEELHEKLHRWHEEYAAEGIPPGGERQERIRKRLEAYVKMKHPEIDKVIEIC